MRRFVYILVASLMAIGLGLGLGNSLAQRTADRNLASRAETAADVWMRHVLAYDTSLLRVLDGVPTGTAAQEALLSLARSENVFEFKIFSREGRPVLTLDTRSGTVVHEPPDIAPQASVKPILRDGTTVVELAVGDGRTGQPRHYAEVYKPILQDGDVIGVFEVYMDITRAAQDTQALFRQLVLTVGMLIAGLMLLPFAIGLVFWFELKRTARRLDAARRDAEEAGRIKSAFLANMSHEIRTPMNGVIALSELLEQSELNAEQRAMTATITSSAVALLSVINDILDFSKIEAGKMSLRPAPFDLLGLVEEVATLFSPAAAAKGVDICIETKLEPPVHVKGDSTRLRQCLLNVVGNAVKFTHRGHVHLIVDRAADGQVVLRVSDTGVGIPEAELDHVFEEFSQIDATDTRQFEGTGLGLAITQRLAHLMGGSLTATSRLGAGSVFTLQLPLPTVVPPAGELVFWREAAASLVRMRVLIVDPQPVTRNAIRAMLSILGARPVAVDPSQDVAALIDDNIRHGLPFDAVMLASDGLPDPGGDSGQGLANQLWTRFGLRLPPCVLMLRADQDIPLAMMGDGVGLQTLRKPAGPRLIAVRLSAAIGRPLERAEGVVPHIRHRTAALEGKIVLLAEDNATNQLVIRKLLANSGVQLEVAANGEEAVELFTRLSPDIVLMDISMPVMNGYDATRLIRTIEARGARDPVPIVALTANAMAEDRTASADAGMSDFLAKPVRRAQLIATLERWLEDPPASAARRA